MNGTEPGYIIRPAEDSDYALLPEFLYLAIYVPEGMEAPDRSILNQKELQVYVRDFGTKESDHIFLAESHGEVIGMVWARIMNDYGHVDNRTPSIAIAVKEEWRGQGIGTVLLNRMMRELTARGYEQVSLSVQKENRAVRLYRRLGFEAVKEIEEEYVMIRPLSEMQPRC